MTWDDVDYKQNVIHITKTATFNKDGTAMIGSSKSEAGKRYIPLNDTIKDILLRQRKKQGSIVQIENRVFTAVYGGIVHNHEINRAISDALARLEEQGKPIEHFMAHALRDTFATRYIEQGGNPQTLKTILGHSSLAMTMDLYSHVLPNTKQKEMDSLKIVLYRHGRREKPPFSIPQLYPNFYPKSERNKVNYRRNMINIVNTIDVIQFL